METTATPVNSDGAYVKAGNLAMVAGFWGILVQALALEWNHNPQYSYGWAILGCVIALSVWRARQGAWETGYRWNGFQKTALAGTLVVWTLTQIVKEANPEWRLTQWVEAISVLILTWLYCLKLGGVSLWARTRASLLLFLTAVPWPGVFEKSIISSFSGWITEAVCEVLHLGGIPAASEGNVIRLLNGLVGVEEACSGIRSFQLAVALTGFFTALFRIPLRKGWVVLAAGAALAFGLNFARTLSLTWIYSQSGEGGYNRWHDVLGFLAQMLLVYGIWALSKRLAPQREATSKHDQRRTLPLAPLRFCGAALVFLAGTLLLKEAWYRQHGKSEAGAPKWSLDWKSDPRFRSETLSPETLASLQSSFSEQVIFSDQQKEWTLFFIRWNGGKNSMRAARAHNPTVCLPASGFVLRSKGFQLIPCGEVFLPFETYTFEANRRAYHVFYCLWEDSWTFPREATENGGQRSDRWWRFQAAWEGKRNRAQQAFEVAMTGYSSLEQASQALRQQLPNLIKISK